MSRKQILDPVTLRPVPTTSLVLMLDMPPGVTTGSVWHTECAPRYWHFDRKNGQGAPGVAVAADTLYAYGTCPGCRLPLCNAVRWVTHPNGATFVREGAAREIARTGLYWHWLGKGFIGHEIYELDYSTPGHVRIIAAGIIGMCKLTDNIRVSNDTFAD